MRILFLAREDALGLATARGAIVGELNREGTLGICGFAAIAASRSRARGPRLSDISRGAGARRFTG